VDPQREPEPVETLVARVRGGRAPSQDDVQAVVGVLRQWLARRGLQSEEVEEVAADAVLRLITAAEAERLDPARPAGAWLRVVADHLALDALQQRRRRGQTVAYDEQAHDLAGDDDRVAALFDEWAAADDVARALRRAGDAGQHEIVRAIATWLDLAAADGEAPSSRRVAERMGVSHMTVQRALRAFRELLRP